MVRDDRQRHEHLFITSIARSLEKDNFTVSNVSSTILQDRGDFMEKPLEGGLLVRDNSGVWYEVVLRKCARQ